MSQCLSIARRLSIQFNDEMIASALQKMLSLQTAGHELDSNVLNDLYWSIQLLPNMHPRRSVFLVDVGDIYMRFHQYQSEDVLDKAVYIYKDTMLNAPLNDTQTHIYAGRYGAALQHRFEQRGIVDDINKSISVLEDAVLLTPDGHTNKPALLNSLGCSLLGCFECLGDLSDINTSVSVFNGYPILVVRFHIALGALGISVALTCPSHCWRMQYD
jgi:hypothetical protein